MHFVDVVPVFHLNVVSEWVALATQYTGSREMHIRTVTNRRPQSAQNIEVGMDIINQIVSTITNLLNFRNFWNLQKDGDVED